MIHWRGLNAPSDPKAVSVVDGQLQAQVGNVAAGVRRSHPVAARRTRRCLPASPSRLHAARLY